jgi:5'-deoxynucleotidase YfbR-like HD superfamily hydrolase
LLHLQDFDEKYAEILRSPYRMKALLCIVLVLKGLVIEDKIFSIYNFSKIVKEIIELSEKEVQMCSLEIRIFIKNLREYISNNTKENSLVFRLTNLEPEYEKLFKDVEQYFGELREDIYQKVVHFLLNFLQAQNFEEMETIIKEFDESIIR